MNSYHHKMLHPRCIWGPKPVPEIPPNRTQTELKKTLRKKAIGKKHVFCLYLSRDIHPIFSTFIKLNFKTVYGSWNDDIKKRAVQVIYNTIIENMLTHCCFKGWYFNFKLCPLVIKLLSISNKCSNDGSFPFNSL